MNKLNVTQAVPSAYSRQQIVSVVQKIETLLNAAASGQITGCPNAAASPPTGTAQSYVIGDMVRNSATSELGSVGNKYVILGWVCTVSGAPGTWKELRCLTGG